MNTTQNIFDCEEAFNKIYEECLETQPMASEAIRTNYEKMHDYFEAYWRHMTNMSFTTPTSVGMKLPEKKYQNCKTHAYSLKGGAAS